MHRLLQLPLNSTIQLLPDINRLGYRVRVSQSTYRILESESTAGIASASGISKKSLRRSGGWGMSGNGQMKFPFFTPQVMTNKGYDQGKRLLYARWCMGGCQVMSWAVDRLWPTSKGRQVMTDSPALAGHRLWLATPQAHRLWTRSPPPSTWKMANGERRICCKHNGVSKESSEWYQIAE